MAVTVNSATNYVLTQDQVDALNNGQPSTQNFQLGKLIDQALARGIPFTKTASLVSTTAGTAVTLVAANLVPSGYKIYITGFIANVTGATAWSGGSLTVVNIQDGAGTPVVAIQIAVAALTGNATLYLHTSNVTPGTSITRGLGLTADKGLFLVGDANAGAGSTLSVTVTGYIAP